MPARKSLLAYSKNHGLAHIRDSSLTPRSSNHGAPSTESTTSLLPRLSPKIDGQALAGKKDSARLSLQAELVPDGASDISRAKSTVDDDTFHGDDQDNSSLSSSGENYLDSGS